MKKGVRYVQGENYEYLRALFLLSIRELNKERDQREAEKRRKQYEGAKV